MYNNLYMLCLEITWGHASLENVNVLPECSIKYAASRHVDTVEVKNSHAPLMHEDLVKQL